MRRIGIIGGSFDPVHIGHINLATDAMTQGKLDEVIFIPVKLQPFKIGKEMTSALNRVKMISLCIEDIKGFSLSTYEVDKEEVSYTYKTLEHLHETLNKEDKLYFICGTDAFLSMMSWKEHEILLKNNSVIVGTRPGYKEDQVETLIETMTKTFNTEVIKIKNRQYDISATQIRERLLNNQPISDLVTKDVERYIRENGLYN